MDDGYEFFADRQLVTIFSAPNYCNEFDNDGAMLMVGEDLSCSFVLLSPIGKNFNQRSNWYNDKQKKGGKANNRPGTPKGKGNKYH